VLISTVDILNALADYNALVLFRTIAATRDGSNILISKMNLSRKQYYSRMSRLAKAGLVNRQNGRYFVTAFGRVVYYTQRLLGSAVNNYWKLKAIDSLGVAYDDKVPREERMKIIDFMIGNSQIKEILLSTSF